jgi:DNA-binding transcriptional regulator PaaX
MKENTKRILSWLYFPKNDLPFFADYHDFRLILPNLTPGGLRSVIHYLVSQDYIATQKLGLTTQLSLTSHGREALSRELRVFSSQLDNWNGNWCALVFLQAPKADPQFRYLRALLLEHHALGLRRGVYLFPGSFPSKITNVCQELYVGKIAIFQLSSWIFGDERSMVNQHLQLSDVANLYSGISKEIDGLLSKFDPQKGLTSALQRQIFSVFSRLFNILEQDSGLTQYYFSSSPRGTKLLAQLQSLARN